MLSASKAYNWVTSIATEAVTSTNNRNCWVYQLAKDVEREWRYRNHNPHFTKEATFESQNYLPCLLTPREATVSLKQWGLDAEEDQQLKMIHAVSTVIETWLQFPTTKDNKNNHKVRCTLISIVTRYLPRSVLFLDEIWFMFLKPYQLLIHGHVGQRISKPHTATTLKLFEASIQKHVMNDPKSKEYLLLSVLNQQMENWFQHTTSKVQQSQQTIPLHNNVSLYS